MIASQLKIAGQASIQYAHLVWILIICVILTNEMH